MNMIESKTLRELLEKLKLRDEKEKRLYNKYVTNALITILSFLYVQQRFEYRGKLKGMYLTLKLFKYRELLR